MKILDIPQSGKRGLNVSQDGQFGQISRAAGRVANPRTPSQMTVRDNLAMCPPAGGRSRRPSAPPG